MTRQYCGQLGKQDNCQVAVSLSLANDGGSLPVAFDLYLPEEWATDPVRRTKAGVPTRLTFPTKPQIALEQIRRARTEELPPSVVLGDAAYGIETDFRTALTALGSDEGTCLCRARHKHVYPEFRITSSRDTPAMAAEVF